MLVPIGIWFYIRNATVSASAHHSSIDARLRAESSLLLYTHIYSIQILLTIDVYLRRCFSECSLAPHSPLRRKNKRLLGMD